MRNFEQMFGASRPYALRKAAAKVVVSMRKITRKHKAPKQARDVVQNPDWAQEVLTVAKKKAKAMPWLVVIRRQRGAVSLIPIQTKRDPKRSVANMGYATSSMNHMLARIGGGEKQKPKHFGARKYQFVARKLLGDDISIRLTNRVPYIFDAYPGIDRDAVANGARALNKEMEQRVDRAFKKAFV